MLNKSVKKNIFKDGFVQDVQFSKDCSRPKGVLVTNFFFQKYEGFTSNTS